MRHKSTMPELSVFDTLGIEAAVMRLQIDEFHQKVTNASIGPVMDTLMADLMEKFKLVQTGLRRCEIEQATNARVRRRTANPKGL
ncbi:hypothetical protein [Phyllobacterium lublinensis]|uniref:hypothetical protein n=1 Tax=Phyllobacterium lublinensis TaxID=2875708 RepID=UPI001CCF764E|nr:hypothetical protein [Phyllobacterium sp. 2063]MBZ9653570.1 hypothetical protein [Phyllobacterium sp. 2063]